MTDTFCDITDRDSTRSIATNMSEESFKTVDVIELPHIFKDAFQHKVKSIVNGLVERTLSSIEPTSYETLLVNFREKLIEQFHTPEAQDAVKKLAEDTVEAFVTAAEPYINTLFQTQSRIVTAGRTVIQGLCYAYVASDCKLLSVTVCLAIADLFNINVFAMPLLLSAVTALSRWRANKPETSFKAEGPSDADVSEVTESLTAIWQLIGTTLGVAEAAPKTMSEWAKSVYKSASKQASATQSNIRFFTNIVNVITRMYEWLISKIYGISAASTMVYREPQIYTKWVEEVNFLLRPENELLVINDAVLYARLSMAYDILVLLDKEICKPGVKDVPPGFFNLKKDLKILKQKAVNLGVATAYRREPVCIWVYGNPGLGKTYLKDAICVKLLQKIRVPTTGNDIFTINSSQKHWTGAEGKQVIYYDDFAIINSDQHNAEAVGQFMQLISDSQFQPPQAAVEDKGKCVAPSLVYVNSNEFFPNLNCIRNEMAFSRRRHFCVKFEKTEQFPYENLEVKGGKDWLKRHETEGNKFPHIKLSLVDPITQEILKGPTSFETLVDWLSEDVALRYQESDSKYRSKINMMQQLTSADKTMPLAEVLDQFAARASVNTHIRESVRNVYGSMTEYAKRAMTISKGWYNGLFTGRLVGESVSDGCLCQPRIVYDLYLDSENKKLYFCGGGYTRAYEEFIKNCPAVEKCAMYKESFHNMVASLPLDADQILVANRLRSMHGFKYGATTETQTIYSLKDVSVQVTETPVPSAAGLILCGLAALGGALLLYNQYRLATKNNKLEEDLKNARKTPFKKEIISSGDSSTSRVKHTGGIRMVKTVKGESISTESQNVDTMMNVIDRNICYLVLSGTDRASQKVFSGFTMRCFGICSNWVIVLNHYIAKINKTDNVKLVFINHAASVEVPFSLENCARKELSDSEMTLIQLPKTIPQFKDVRNHIISQNMVEKMTSQALIYEKDLGMTPIKHSVRISVQDNLVFDSDGIEVLLPAAITYKWHAPGRCMSIVTSRFERDFIVGFHVCGGNGLGGAEPVVSETFDMLGSVKSAEMALEEYTDETSSPMVILDMQVYPEGVTKPQFSARPAQKTRIEPSLIHGYVEPTTVPAPLKPADVDHAFSPLISGCEKHGLRPSGFDPQLLKEAQDHLREEYLTKCLPVRLEVGVLSLNDAVVGISGIDGYEGMELNTSEGFPFTGRRPKTARNKRYQFEIDEVSVPRKLVGLDPWLKREMDRKLALRKQNVIPATVFTDSLKDARISKAKFLIPGKTRIFSISPTDYTIHCRQYLLDILASQKQHRLNLQHAVGISVHSLEWTLLARKLQEKGPKVFCGDYSNFGPSLDCEVVKAVGDVWCDWYQHHEEKQGVPNEDISERRRIREILIEEARFAIHQCGNVLYRVLCGAPSGSPFTVNLNNDVNKMYIYMAWLDCFKDKPVYRSFVSFRKHVNLFVYGDDLIANVSDEVAEIFNNEFLAKFFKRHNIAYTDDSKSSTIVKYVTLGEASFLKGKWIKNEDHVMAFNYALSKKSLEDIANWVHSDPDKIGATRQAICDSLMYAYGWGRKYFNMHRERMLVRWRESCPGEEIELYTYDNLDCARFGFGYIQTEDIAVLVKREQEWREKQKIEKSIASGLTPLVPLELREECVKPQGPIPSIDSLRLLIKHLRRLDELTYGKPILTQSTHDVMRMTSSLEYGSCTFCGRQDEIPATSAYSLCLK